MRIKRLVKRYFGYKVEGINTCAAYCQRNQPPSRLFHANNAPNSGDPFHPEEAHK